MNPRASEGRSLRPIKDPTPSGKASSSSGMPTLDDISSYGMAEQIASAMQGSHVFVTGTSGFLGKVWLSAMLSQGPCPRRLTLILRRKRGVDAWQRFETMLLTSPAFRPVRARFGERLIEAVREIVEVVEGDTSLPQIGMDRATYDRLATEVDAVLHFAGLTDFEPDPTQALASNVDGALYAAEFAHRSRGQRLLHVSTAFVAGCNGGEVPEDVAPGVSPRGAAFDAEQEVESLRAALGKRDNKAARIQCANERAAALGWPNIYTYTKGLAEKLLFQRMQRNLAGLQVSIVRPSIVESAMHRPFPGWNEGVNTSAPLVWLLGTSFRFFPSQPQHRFDVIPVDYVATGTTAVLGALLAGQARDVYHLASSASHPLTFRRAIELTGLATRRMHQRTGKSFWQRHVLPHLDAVHAPKRPRWAPSVATWRSMNATLREQLSNIVMPKGLPTQVSETAERKLKALRTLLRNNERRYATIETLLRVYKPFIHDHDYIFLTCNIDALFQSLAQGASATGHGDAQGQDDVADHGAEAASLVARLRYDMQGIDWRFYWVHVHVPGLEIWSLPLMRGERPPEDPMPACFVREASKRVADASARVAGHETTAGRDQGMTEGDGFDQGGGDRPDAGVGPRAATRAGNGVAAAEGHSEDAATEGRKEEHAVARLKRDPVVRGGERLGASRGEAMRCHEGVTMATGPAPLRSAR